MKRKPYVITENMKAPAIIDLINRAYEEGYEDGKTEATVIHGQTITTPWITTPLRDIQTTPGTPNDWPNTIYCSSDTEIKESN